MVFASANIGILYLNAHTLHTETYRIEEEKTYKEVFEWCSYVEMIHFDTLAACWICNWFIFFSLYRLVSQRIKNQEYAITIILLQKDRKLCSIYIDLTRQCQKMLLFLSHSNLFVYFTLAYYFCSPLHAVVYFWSFIFVGFKLKNCDDVHKVWHCRQWYATKLCISHHPNKMKHVCCVYKYLYSKLITI